MLTLQFQCSGISAVYIHVAEQGHVVVLSAKYTVHLNHGVRRGSYIVVTAGVVEHIFNA